VTAGKQWHRSTDTLSHRRLDDLELFCADEVLLVDWDWPQVDVTTLQWFLHSSGDETNWLRAGKIWDELTMRGSEAPNIDELAIFDSRPTDGDSDNPAVTATGLNRWSFITQRGRLGSAASWKTMEREKLLLDMTAFGKEKFCRLSSAASTTAATETAVSTDKLDFSLLQRLSTADLTTLSSGSKLHSFGSEKTSVWKYDAPQSTWGSWARQVCCCWITYNCLCIS